MGALTVRFPKSLHVRIKALAEQEGISMNQFVLLATAEKAAAMDTRVQIAWLEARADRATERAARKGMTPETMLRDLLDRAPDGDPDPQDRIPEEL